MKLYLIRHSKAEKNAPDGNDAKRKLTPKGKTHAFRKAEKWRKILNGCDLLLSSPFDRAKETAEIFASVLKKNDALQMTPLLGAGTRAEDVLKGLRDYAHVNELALFGHGPWLNELVSLLIAGTTQAQIELKKPCLVVLEVERLAPHGAILTKLV